MLRLEHDVPAIGRPKGWGSTARNFVPASGLASASASRAARIHSRSAPSDPLARYTNELPSGDREKLASLARRVVSGTGMVKRTGAGNVVGFWRKWTTPSALVTTTATAHPLQASHGLGAARGEAGALARSATSPALDAVNASSISRRASAMSDNPSLAILLQAAAQQSVDRRMSRRRKRAEVRLALDDAGKHVGDLVALERAPTRQHLSGTQPNAQISVRLSTAFPLACSGLM